MNGTIAGQLVFFVLIGALLMAASLYLSGQFDSISAVRDFVQTSQV
jgi:hypothetical protein